jgi:hypothetical protein
MTDLKALARPYRFRVVPDAEGYLVMPGRSGRLEQYDDAHLAVYSTAKRLWPVIWAIPGVRRWQTGDLEMRALVPREAWLGVAKLIGVRKKRPGTAAGLRNLRPGARPSARNEVVFA